MAVRSDLVGWNDRPCFMRSGKTYWRLRKTQTQGLYDMNSGPNGQVYDGEFKRKSRLVNSESGSRDMRYPSKCQPIAACSRYEFHLL